MQTISSIFRKEPRRGEWGIEIEVENKDFTLFENLEGRQFKHWNLVSDGSLRNGMEFVGKNIIQNRDHLLVALKEIDDLKLSIVSNPRAGVHIHSNCTNMTLRQWINYIILYLALDPVIVLYGGKDRVGNHFCLRPTDAEYFILTLRSAIQKRNWGSLRTDNIRYCSINLLSMFKFGTVEFRSLQTPKDLYKIVDCVDIHKRIKQHSLLYEYPDDLIEQFSHIGFSNILINILGEELYKKLEIPENQIEELILEGISTAQDIAYCTDWRQEYYE